MSSLTGVLPATSRLPEGIFFKGITRRTMRSEIPRSPSQAASQPLQAGHL